MNKTKHEQAKSEQKQKQHKETVQHYESPANEHVETVSTKGVVTTHQKQQKHHHHRQSHNKHKKSSSSSTAAAAATSSSTITTAAPATSSSSAAASSSTSSSPHTTTHTQFSVQRSDVDGLRMKISAIRTPATPAAPPTAAASSSSSTSSSSSSSATSNSNLKDKLNHNNNNIKTNTTTAAAASATAKGTVATSTTTIKTPTLKVKLSRSQKLLQKHAMSVGMLLNNGTATATAAIATSANSGGNGATDVSTTTTTMPPSQISTTTSNNSAASSSNSNTCMPDTTSNTTTPAAASSSSTLAPSNSSAAMRHQASSYLSDATESGCSEATTTTIFPLNEKPAKKIKVKRKKAQSKQSALSKSKFHKKARVHSSTAASGTVASATTTNNTFSSSDTDEEPPSKPKKSSSKKSPSVISQPPTSTQQRAPRLLLTAINSTKPSSSSLHLKAFTAPPTTTMTGLLLSTSSMQHGTAASGANSDNIGLSSSDNELPDLVNAAIRRVESDSDDTVGGDSSYRRGRTRNAMPQYQSTLLQDFMEKTAHVNDDVTSHATVCGSTSAMAASEAVDDACNDVTQANTAERRTAELLANSNTNSQSESIASSTGACGAASISAASGCSAVPHSSSSAPAKSKTRGARGQATATTTTTTNNTSAAVAAGGSAKKRRGRPKKPADEASAPAVPVVAPIEIDTTTHHAQRTGGTAVNINESADSGVISTTSTTQSATPSPRVSSATTGTPSSRATRKANAMLHSPAKSVVSGGSQEPAVSSTSSTAATTNAAAAATKPKIDIAYLDKRMYATERVLYPPPRNKRRQSTKLAAASGAVSTTTTTANAATTSSANTNNNNNRSSAKESADGQLDPVWRKIDVNKKFRRPSLSGYKSDGGGGNTTICSKVLAAKSGYVSDYGSFHPRSSRQHAHQSGYKSDASCKSRYSTRSCVSRRSRAKSCGYRSDCKESGATLSKSSKYRRKRRASMVMHSLQHQSGGNTTGGDKSAVDLSDVQDILQLAGLSLGQSSEESNEYVCKPSLASLPTPSASKKYGEINRFIATGEYFGRGSSSTAQASNREDASQDGYSAAFSGKLLLQRKNSHVSDIAPDLLPHASTLRKIKSRRSSVASYCSSFYSGTSKVRRRRRRKSFRFPNSSMGGKNAVIDSKLLTDIDIITSTFGSLCSINGGGGLMGSLPSTSHGLGGSKEKLMAEATKLQHSLAVAALAGSNSNTMTLNAATSGSLTNAASAASALSALAAAGVVSNSSGGKGRDKRNLKKRKANENLVDFAMLSKSAAAAAAANASGQAGGAAGNSTPGSTTHTPSSGGGGGGTKRRHKKANSSSPDDHKLPLKKRHYLLTPGEKPSEATLSISAKMYANSTEAWAAAAAAAKSTASTKSQQQFANAQKNANSGTAKPGITPKKRHLLHNAVVSGTSAYHLLEDTRTPSIKSSNSSPLRIAVDHAAAAANAATTSGTSNSISGGKLLDISPISLSSLKQQTEARKRTRLEGYVNSMAHSPNARDLSSAKSSAAASRHHQNNNHIVGTPELDADSSSCPPPGVFEPSVELEIQIPPIAKLSEAAASIITKSEVDSPLLGLELSNSGSTCTKTEGTRVVETLLNKTGGNLILKRKRKKINRTGFPTVRRKKRKINELLLLDVAAVEEALQSEIPAEAASVLSTPKTRERTKSMLVTAPQSSLGCDRVPQAGEASESFLERANRTPRLSVVALERLQGTPTPTTTNASIPLSKSGGRQTPFQAKSRRQKKGKQQQTPELQPADSNQPAELQTPPKTPLARPSTKRTLQKQQQQQLEQTPVKNVRVSGRKSKAALAAEDALIEPPPTSLTMQARTPSTQGRKNAKQTKASGGTPTKSQPAAAIINPTPATTQASSSTVTSTNKPRRKSPILTARALQAKVKLPAGIDPNTNFSCKIRLKRRNTLHPLALTNTQTPAANSPLPASAEVIEAEAAAKANDAIPNEHDILPMSEAIFADNEATASDTSDEKSARNAGKQGRWRKNYLPAGLLSDYFKITQPSKQSKKAMAAAHAAAVASGVSSASSTSSLTSSSTSLKSDSSDNARKSLLPPPPYCEAYLRRTLRDFQLPYDIWWAYENSKLPARNTVPSWNYRKIRTNIYAESVRPNTAGIDHPTCNCKRDVGCSDNCLNRMVYTECSPSNCPAREKCHNQKIQRHEVAPGVERFMTADKGWGVRTNNAIAKGTYILEYVGEVVTEREFKDRMGTIYRNDTHHYCLHLDGGLVIDGHRMGSDGRFVNHSCEPNCEMQKWSVNGLSRMALFAKRNIEPGEELTYDYNFALFNPAEGQPCYCKMTHCRGVIGGKSQRIKPLPSIEQKPTDAQLKDGRSKRQRKHKASKNAQRQPAATKEVAVARVQQLSDREKKLVKQTGIFLLRNFEKIRRCKAKCLANGSTATPALSNSTANAFNTTAPPASSPSNASSESATNTSTTTTTQNAAANGTASAASISSRRPSTPASLAAQISALCTPRSIKTRGLSLAVQDPELEKMAKMAVILRDICTTLETLRHPNTPDGKLIAEILHVDNSNKVNANGHAAASNSSDTTSTNKKKKMQKAAAAQQKQSVNDLKAVLANIEQGFYKQPADFDDDMQKLFQEMRRGQTEDEVEKRQALEALMAAYEQQKLAQHSQLLELIGDAKLLSGFGEKEEKREEAAKVANEAKLNGECGTEKEDAAETAKSEQLTTTTTAADVSAPMPVPLPAPLPQPLPNSLNNSSEDIIRCICGLYKDEGVMIQCARCMVWQHTECTKADVNADHYQCERCEPREVDREIPLDDYTEDGHRYYLSLMRGELQVRQGDAVYVLRDIPIKDASGKALPSKHTYETIGAIDYNECDIFRVERLWKTADGKRCIFGHHFLRPHETFHEPTRRFYPNEVVRVPLYEVVPVELVIGRCWVLDRTTFCKGRPIECTMEEHCYICELRVDKTARFFSKAKINYPSCTKSYAFRKFPEKLRISKTYAPHVVDPSMLKKKHRNSSHDSSSCIATNHSQHSTVVMQEQQQTVASTAALAQQQQTGGAIPKTSQPQQQQQQQQLQGRNKYGGGGGRGGSKATTVQQQQQQKQSSKEKRSRLDSVLKTLKLQKQKQNPQLSLEPAVDLTYLVTGRGGARQRKTAAAAAAAAAAITATLAPIAGVGLPIKGNKQDLDKNKNQQQLAEPKTVAKSTTTTMSSSAKRAERSAKIAAATAAMALEAAEPAEPSTEIEISAETVKIGMLPMPMQAELTALTSTDAVISTKMETMSVEPQSTPSPPPSASPTTAEASNSTEITTTTAEESNAASQMPSNESTATAASALTPIPSTSPKTIIDSNSPKNTHNDTPIKSSTAAANTATEENATTEAIADKTITATVMPTPTPPTTTEPPTDSMKTTTNDATGDAVAATSASASGSDGVSV